MRKVLPISTIILLAVFGCTMNRMPGDGQPVTATPSMNPATTPGSSYGTTPLSNPSMSSSYLTPVSDTTVTTVSRADRAAAIMRQHQAAQGRFLGYLDPVPIVQQPQQYETGQFIPPSMTANPELTVNSSISSNPYPVITGGPAVSVGAGGGFVLPGGSTATGTTATATGLNAAATVGTTATTANTTATNGAAALTPTASSAATPSPIATSNALFGMSTTTNNAGNVPMASATTTTTPTTSAQTLTTVRQGSGQLVIASSVPTVAPIVVTATPTGQFMISNVRVRAVRP